MKTAKDLNSQLRAVKTEFYKSVALRDDVLAIQQSNGNYFPEKNTDGLDAYLDESKTIGVYLIGPGDLVEAACIDIDVNKEAIEAENGNIDVFQPDLQKLVTQIIAVLESKGHKGVVEYSGYKGYHIWILLEAPTPASKVRAALKIWMTEFGDFSDDLHFEIFPKQDSVPEGGYGNLIKLPLQRHQKSGRYGMFVDANFNEIIPDYFPKNTIEDGIEISAPKTYSSMHRRDVTAPPQNMDLMLDQCEILKGLLHKAKTEKYLTHEERIFIANLLLPFGPQGIKKIHEIFRQLEDYDPDITDHQLASLRCNPSLCERMCNSRCAGIKTKSFYSPIGFAYKTGDIYEKRGRYMKKSSSAGTFQDIILADWLIQPKELINLGAKDVLSCDIKSTQEGGNIDGMHLENEAWHSKQKLLRQLGHSDLTFHGNDSDVQKLAQHVTQRVPIRSTGIDYVGMKGDTFVAEGINITEDEISTDPSIKVYIRGDDSLARRVQIPTGLSTHDNKNLIQGVYDHLPSINDADIIYPLIAWLFLLPLKERIQQLRGGFFILHGYGEQGCGKTSAIELGLRLYSFEDPTVFDARMTPFAMLSLLSSTNSLPVVLDEYKESDMTSWNVQQIKARLRGLYRGSLESRGHADQTTTNYKLRSPVALMGEFKISEPALQERMIFAPFGRAIKVNQVYVDHFQRLASCNLEDFTAKYIQWALGQDIDDYYLKAQRYFKSNSDFVMLPPRVKENWLALHCGLQMWKRFGREIGVRVAGVPVKDIFSRQALELGLTKTGSPKRDVDILMEHIADLAEKGEIKASTDWAWHKDHVLIRTDPVLAALRRYRKSTDGSFYIMDDQSFKNQIKQSKYFLKSDRAKPYGGIQRRWIWLDYDKMDSDDLEVEGFQSLKAIFKMGEDTVDTP